jgi:hypothetical protein
MRMRGQAMTDTRTVSTLEEWQAWAVEKKPPSRMCPTVIASGELAAQIRRRFDVAPDAPVRISEAYDMARMQLVMSVDVNYTPETRSNVKDVSIAAEDFHGNYDWALFRAWLTGEL